MIAKPSIILVDDHLPFRQGLKSFLTEGNIASVVAEASNGIELLELLAHIKPDIVLMDIDMPEMNGIEATQRALEIFPNLKVIVFTMFGDSEYTRIMKDLGAKAFILKSKGISEIEKVIHEVMEGKNLLSQVS